MARTKTPLTVSQAEMLNSLAQRKGGLRQQEAEMRARHELELAKLRENLLDEQAQLVAALLDSGTPKVRIAEALGTKNYGNLKEMDVLAQQYRKSPETPAPAEIPAFDASVQILTKTRTNPEGKTVEYLEAADPEEVARSLGELVYVEAVDYGTEVVRKYLPTNNEWVQAVGVTTYDDGDERVTSVETSLENLRVMRLTDTVEAMILAAREKEDTDE